MRELSAQFPRFGYRRTQVFLERLRYQMSADRAHRLWRCAGLQIARKKGPADVLRHSASRLAATAWMGVRGSNTRVFLISLQPLPNGVSGSMKGVSPER